MAPTSVKRIRATLVILSATRSVKDIVGIVGLEPDWTTERGTPVSSLSENLRKYTAVAFNSRLPPDASPADHVTALLRRLTGATGNIRELSAAPLAPESRGVPVSFSLTIESSRAMFGFELSPEQLSEIADLGAHFGVEVAVDDDFAAE
jgi:hypothetical protein